jgi:ubiquitin carboxyl-terminal hydrolase 25/28
MIESRGRPDPRLTCNANCRRLFSGEVEWKYINKKLDDSTDIFNTIFVPLAAKPKDITAGLDEEFTLDDIPEWGDGVKRYKTITELPPIFQIYLQRQDFDHARQDAVINKHHIQLEEVIYLDRFANPELQPLRERSWELDAAIKSLRAQKAQLEATSVEEASAPDVLDSTWQFVSSLGEEMTADEAALGDAVRSRAESLRAGARRLQNAIDAREREKAALFDGHRSLAYRLTAVFMHRGHGGASGGHYWVYVHDARAGGWRRYEDREVRAVADAAEIYGAADPETAGAPYYVVYVREEEAARLVDAVCRVDPAAAQDVGGEDGDTHMGGTEAPEEALVPLGAEGVPLEPMVEDEVVFKPMIS